MAHQEAHVFNMLQTAFASCLLSSTNGGGKGGQFWFQSIQSLQIPAVFMKQESHKEL